MKRKFSTQPFATTFTLHNKLGVGMLHTFSHSVRVSRSLALCHSATPFFTFWSHNCVCTPFYRNQIYSLQIIRAFVWLWKFHHLSRLTQANRQPHNWTKTALPKWNMQPSLGFQCHRRKYKYSSFPNTFSNVRSLARCLAIVERMIQFGENCNYADSWLIQSNNESSNGTRCVCVVFLS